MAAKCDTSSKSDDSYGNSVIVYSKIYTHFFKSLREGLLGHVIRRCLWHLNTPDLTPCDLYLRRSVKGKVYKRNSHTLQYPRYNICREISGQKVQKVNNVFRSCTEYIRVRRATFSVSAVELMVFGRLSKGYCHGGCFSSFPSPTVKLPETRRVT